MVFGTKHKLNDEKIDIVVFGTKHKLPQMKDIRVTIGAATLKASSNVRNLGVVFDSSNHISAICRTAYMHLHNISRIRRHLTIDATKLLVHAFVMSKLYYGNALLASLPLEHLNTLQRIQNMATGIITFTLHRDHITPTVTELHWLPVKCRIEFKILVHVPMSRRQGTAVSYEHVDETMLYRAYSLVPTTYARRAAIKAC